MSRRLKVAVIGTGIGERHIMDYAQLPELFEIAALCSLDQDRGEAISQRFAVPDFTTDFETLLRRRDIDVIDICTPPGRHYEMTRKAVMGGHHVICEKPLFGSIAEIDAMAAIVTATGLQVMPIFQYRFGMGLQRLKRLVDLGLAGQPILTTIETHWWRGPDYYEAPWRGKWKTELGGGLLGHAIHAHDMLNYIHGPISEVFAHCATLVNRIEVEDTSALSVGMGNGSLAALSMTLGSRKEISRLRFCFRDLVAESNLEPYTMSHDPWTFVAGEPDHQKRIDAALDAVRIEKDGYARQFELFHSAISNGGETPVTLVDARHSLELVTAAYHSARTGRPATLPIGPDHPLYHGWLPDRA